MLFYMQLFIILPILVYIIFSYFYQKYSRRFYYNNKIPGRKPYPIIGNLFDILKPVDVLFKEDRLRSLEYYPIWKSSVLNETMVCPLLPEDIELLFGGRKHLTKHMLYDILHQWLGTGLLTSDGAKWHSRRKLLTPAFHFTILQEFVNIFNRETLELISNIEKQIDQPYINVLPLIADFTLRSIVETSTDKRLDWKNANSRNYRSAVEQFGQLFIYFSCRPWLNNPFAHVLNANARKLSKITKTLHQFTNDVIREKKKQFESDTYSIRKQRALLNLLLKLQADGADIDDEGIREELDTFVFEGHDTTAIAICFSLLILANYQHYQDEIYREIIDVLGDSEPTYSNLQELQLMDRCIKEILRLYPSVPTIGRTLSEDVQTTTGYFLPKGTYVNLHIYDVHHSPHLYEDPEKFDPDRFLPENCKERHPFAYIPFSVGSRNCIGQRYALLEIKSVLCGILRRFKLEPIDRREDIVLVTDIVLRTRNPIRVRFIPRASYTKFAP